MVKKAKRTNAVVPKANYGTICFRFKSLQGVITTIYFNTTIFLTAVYSPAFNL
jgi:hypothetical protein